MHLIPRGQCTREEKENGEGVSWRNGAPLTFEVWPFELAWWTVGRRLIVSWKGRGLIGTWLFPFLDTVDSVLTHSNPWTPKAMGYYRVWVLRGGGPRTGAAGDSGRG